jgi:putative phage-type endonuclease
MTKHAEYLGTFPSGSPAWHAVRATGIGGSEIAAVLGLSPYESRFSLWHRKQQLAAPTMENDQMRWGTLLEDVIAHRFALEHPELRVRRTGTWRSKAHPYQIANPDRLVKGGVAGGDQEPAVRGRVGPIG